jgi:predicted dinucleotide-binding enzyme
VCRLAGWAVSAMDIVDKLIEDAGFAAVDLGPNAYALDHGGPPPAGLRLLRRGVPAPEARAVAEAVLQGQEIPPATADH